MSASDNMEISDGPSESKIPKVERSSVIENIYEVWSRYKDTSWKFLHGKKLGAAVIFSNRHGLRIPYRGEVFLDASTNMMQLRLNKPNRVHMNLELMDGLKFSYYRRRTSCKLKVDIECLPDTAKRELEQQVEQFTDVTVGDSTSVEGNRLSLTCFKLFVPKPNRHQSQAVDVAKDVAVDTYNNASQPTTSEDAAEEEDRQLRKVLKFHASSEEISPESVPSEGPERMRNGERFLKSITVPGGRKIAVYAITSPSAGVPCQPGQLNPEIKLQIDISIDHGITTPADPETSEMLPICPLSHPESSSSMDGPATTSDRTKHHFAESMSLQEPTTVLNNTIGNDGMGAEQGGRKRISDSRESVAWTGKVSKGSQKSSEGEVDEKEPDDSETQESEQKKAEFLHGLGSAASSSSGSSRDTTHFD